MHLHFQLLNTLGVFFNTVGLCIVNYDDIILICASVKELNLCRSLAKINDDKLDGLVIMLKGFWPQHVISKFSVFAT